MLFEILLLQLYSLLLFLFYELYNKQEKGTISVNAHINEFGNEKSHSLKEIRSASLLCAK